MATQKIISVPKGRSATPTRDFQEDNIIPIAIPEDNICPKYGYSSLPTRDIPEDNIIPIAIPDDNICPKYGWPSCQ